MPFGMNLSGMGNMFSWLKRRVEKTTAHYLGNEGELQESWELESDIIIREVNQLAKALMFREGLTLEEKEGMVTKIGHMAYMGAPEAGKTAGTCLQEMITLLKSKKTAISLKEKLIMAISEICYLNRDNQNKATSALPCLLDIMGNTDNIHLSRVACYCISCIVCNNYSMLHYLLEIPTLKENLSKCLSVDRPWIGWPENYAVLLVDILALSNDMANMI